MTPNQLKEIRERAEKATAGSWEAAFYDGPIFIAHARQDIPALLAHIDALDEHLECLQVKYEGTQRAYEHKCKLANRLVGVCRMMQTWIEQNNDDDKEIETLTLLTVSEAIDAAIKASEGGNNE